MGVYNCENTLIQAVNSIINQTYDNWELIICDDGSNDRTYEIALELSKRDTRIKLLKNTNNKGLNYTLNKCLEYANGEYIGRMDGDDDCSPDRFAKEIKFLESNPEISIVSCRVKFYDETGFWGESSLPKSYPTKEDVVTGTAISHAPVLIKHNAMLKIGGYSNSYWTLRVEDVDLWIRFYTAGYKAANILESLYYMRNDKNAFKRRKYKYRINSTITRLRGCYNMHLGLKCYIKSFLPMISGLIPMQIRRLIRKNK